MVIEHALQGSSQVLQNSRIKVVAVKPGGPPGDTAGYICIDPEALIFLSYRNKKRQHSDGNYKLHTATILIDDFRRFVAAAGHACDVGT